MRALFFSELFDYVLRGFNVVLNKPVKLTVTPQSRGFVMSDHADWEGLNQAILATGCERVFVTHGYTSVFRRWLDAQGYDAGVVQTEFGDADDADEG